MLNDLYLLLSIGVKRNKNGEIYLDFDISKWHAILHMKVMRICLCQKQNIFHHFYFFLHQLRGESINRMSFRCEIPIETMRASYWHGMLH